MGLTLGEKNILWNIDQHRPWSPRGGNVERLLDSLGNVSGVFDQEIIFSTNPRHSHDVSFLEGIIANHGPRHLSGDNDHGNRIHVSGHDARNGIGSSRSRGHQADTDFSGGARIPICHMGRTLFMAHQNMF